MGVESGLLRPRGGKQVPQPRWRRVLGELYNHWEIVVQLEMDDKAAMQRS